MPSSILKTHSVCVPDCMNLNSQPRYSMDVDKIYSLHILVKCSHYTETLN